MSDDQLTESIRAFILRRLLKDHDPAHVTSTTPLVSSGLLDSIAVTELLMFLEDEFRVQFDASDADPARFDTIELIAERVRHRLNREDHA
jgi:acyl carrier protein